jgi:hypothetical protein
MEKTLMRGRSETNNAKKEKAFTLIESPAVISIIVRRLAILMSFLGKARNSSYRRNAVQI